MSTPIMLAGWIELHHTDKPGTKFKIGDKIVRCGLAHPTIETVLGVNTGVGDGTDIEYAITNFPWLLYEEELMLASQYEDYQI